jgi:hypothetical protein
VTIGIAARLQKGADRLGHLRAHLLRRCPPARGLRDRRVFEAMQRDHRSAAISVSAASI